MALPKKIINNNMFATRLLAMMETHKVTQQALAARLQVSQGTISGWCNGRMVPYRRTAQALADAFGVRVEWLLYGKGEKLNAESARAGEQVLRTLPIAPAPSPRDKAKVRKALEGVETAVKRLREALGE